MPTYKQERAVIVIGFIAVALLVSLIGCFHFLNIQPDRLATSIILGGTLIFMLLYGTIGMDYMKI